MKCPYCGHRDDRVIDSRETRAGEATRRRRECLSCKRRYTTYEHLEEIAYIVVKKDSRRERFNRKKLMEGLLKACEKRPVETRAIEAIADDVEAMLSERVDREVRAQEVGAFVMGRLHELDKVAYVRFASVYKDFQDPEEFVKEIHGIFSDRKTARSDGRPDSRKKTTRRAPKSRNPGEP